MPKVPEYLTKNILDRVMADLQPSVGTVNSRVGVAVSVGGLISLLFCGQFGIGGTPFAIEVNRYFHASNEMICALVCGALFAVVPVAILRLLCNHHLFRVIIKKKFYVVAMWVGLFGALLGYHGDFGNEILAVLTWFAAALIVFWLGSFAFYCADRFGVGRRHGFNH